MPNLTVPVSEERLQQWLRDVFGDQGTTRILEQVHNGSSNITLFIEHNGQDLVLRMPPRGELLPTSHDVSREYKYLTALTGSDIPVPRPLAFCDDPDVLGSPFYIMERLQGRPLQAGIPPALNTIEGRRAVGEAAIDVLARLHAFDWRGHDLPGRPGGYLERQIKRWETQLSLTESASRLEGIEQVAQWLRQHLPEDSKTTIVHGDYGLHNMILSSDLPVRVIGVLDWEMATLGDPLADLVWFVRDWGNENSRNPANQITCMEGALSRDEMIARYEEKSGTRLVHRKFYEVLSAWKGTVIWEGLYDQYLKGNAANPQVARFEKEVPEMWRRLQQMIDED